MAVRKPAEMDFSDKRFMLIIAGQPGLGKTTLALSAPKPFLFDTDNGIARVKAEHRCDTSSVSSYDELLEDMKTDEFKACETVVIDTGGSLVSLMKDWARRQDKKAEKDGRAMFGVIKTEFDRLCWQIRNANKHLIVVFHTTEQQKNDTIQTRLSCEGGAKDIVWTPADFGGYVKMIGKRRTIDFTPCDEYFAKGCFGIHGELEVPALKDGDKNDFVTRLFANAQAYIASESKSHAEEKAKYTESLNNGLKIIETITDAATANAARESLADIEYHMTAKAEVMAAFKATTKSLGLKLNKESNCYE